MKKIIALFFAFIIISFSGTISVHADEISDLQTKINALNSQINNIQSQRNQLQNQVNTNKFTLQGFNTSLTQLYGQIELNSKEINQLQLQIKQNQLQIQLTDDTIASEKKEIVTAENTISNLDTDSSLRIEDNFVNFKAYGNNDSFNSVVNFSKINDYFKSSMYKELIQADTNDIMVKLTQLKTDLNDKKTKLEQDLSSLKQTQDTLTAQQGALQQKNNDLNMQVGIYNTQLNIVEAQNNNTESQVSSLDQMKAQKQEQIKQLQNEIQSDLVIHQPPSGGSGVGANGYIQAGTPIGIQGRTGVATAIHLHFVVIENGVKRDPCGYLPGGFVIDIFGLGNCGSGNRLAWPERGTVYYTNTFYGSCIIYCPHGAIDIQGWPLSAVVYAANSGYVSKFTDRSGANVVQICENTDCNKGIVTQYWHLSRFLI